MDSANDKFTTTQSASDATSLSHRAGLINSTNPLFEGFTGIEPVRSFHHGQARTYENPIEFGGTDTLVRRCGFTRPTCH